jgi:hypothetical protein
MHSIEHNYTYLPRGSHISHVVKHSQVKESNTARTSNYTTSHVAATSPTWQAQLLEVHNQVIV